MIMPMDREAAVERLQRELERLLCDEISYLESSRIVSRLRFELDAEEDPDFTVFLVIDSETDHLPVGMQRRYWSADALAQKDAEMQSAEQWARSIGETAAHNLWAKCCFSKE